MKKLNDTQILKAIQENGTETEKLAKVLNISKSNMFYRLRKLKDRGLLSTNNQLLEKSAVNESDKNADSITQILYSQYNAKEFIPEPNPDYKLRNIDSVINKYSGRNIPVLLIGESGAGKTEAVKQYGANHLKPFLRVACDDTAVLKEFIGRREIINGTTYFRTGLLIELLQQPSVILFDEFNALPSSRLFFLHELLDNRRIFIKDADGGKIINVHPECKLFLACNPNNARYSGTNKINVALADRCAVVDVEQFSVEEMNGTFETGKKGTTESLKQFYEETTKVIREQNLRVTFSLRAVKRCAEAIRAGDTIKESLQYGFYNIALATASQRERNAIEQIARVCFGIENFEPKQESESNV